MKESFEVQLSERLKQMIANEVIEEIKEIYDELAINEMTIGNFKELIKDVAIEVLEFNPCKKDLFDILSKVLKGLN